MAAVAIGFAIPAAPYMAIIGDFTNKRAMKDDAKEEVHEDARAPVGGPVFAESVPNPRAVWAGVITAKESLKAGHYGVAVFALIGLVLTARRVWSSACAGHAAAITASVKAPHETSRKGRRERIRS
mgnify:CR=1 FL=1